MKQQNQLKWEGVIWALMRKSIQQRRNHSDIAPSTERIRLTLQSGKELESLPQHQKTTSSLWMDVSGRSPSAFAFALVMDTPGRSHKAFSKQIQAATWVKGSPRVR